MKGQGSIVLLQIVLLNMKFGLTVKDLKLHLPSVVKLRSQVVLECSFKLENESLYSIKLYKGREEFLHFVPAFSPPYKVFATKGVNVSWTNFTLGTTELYYKGASPFQYNTETKNIIANQFVSGSLSVILRSVSLFSAGLFGCEVSADYPEYDTDIRRKHLHVFVSPSSRPHVTGLQTRYKPGDVLNITCLSADSFPAANISWFINGNKASSNTVDNTTVKTEKSGLLSSYSQLSMLATDKLIIKCVASILTSFWQSTDQVVNLLEPPMSPVLTDRKDQPGSVTSRATRGGWFVGWILVIFQFASKLCNDD
eukprot:TRINITY_DN27267_c0_g1_i1.p1 TRINITY_DN27267_c0_g1~~TRINITY_DN27267_c0_g1_i1.p1  ORF type:complete len:311 (-),score=17.10 TRINITY_DN27267_c0_g1_i1:434-1366(-)